MTTEMTTDFDSKPDEGAALGFWQEFVNQVVVFPILVTAVDCRVAAICIALLRVGLVLPKTCAAEALRSFQMPLHSPLTGKPIGAPYS